jgi:hypothetical protein
VAVLATWVYVFLVTSLIFLALKAVMGLRVEEEEEITGLDLTVHGESGYSLVLAEAGSWSLIPRSEKKVEEKPPVKKVGPGPAFRVPPRGEPVSSLVSPPVSRRTFSKTISERKTTPVAVLDKGPFVVEVRGLEEKWLAEWWRTLCHSDWGKIPDAFRDIYPLVTRFDGQAFTVSKGDAEAFCRKIEGLLRESGFTDFEVRLAK